VSELPSKVLGSEVALFNAAGSAERFTVAPLYERRRRRSQTGATATQNRRVGEQLCATRLRALVGIRIRCLRH